MCQSLGDQGHHTTAMMLRRKLQEGRLLSTQVPQPAVSVSRILFAAVSTDGDSTWRGGAS